VDAEWHASVAKHRARAAHHLADKALVGAQDARGRRGGRAPGRAQAEERLSGATERQDTAEAAYQQAGTVAQTRRKAKTRPPAGA